MPEAPGADRIREALHASVDHEAYRPMPAPVVQRARRRLRRNVAIATLLAVALLAAVLAGGSLLSDFTRTSPAQRTTYIPDVPSSKCCMPPTESLVYQAPDGSVRYASIDGTRAGTVLYASQAVATTPDGANLLEVTSDGYLGIYPGGHDFVPVGRTNASFSGAAIAPDAQHVAIATDGQLVERTVGRAGRRILVPVEPGPTLRNPAWSPDGSHIAYIRSGAGNDLMVLDLATGRSRVVLPNVVYATWSPDGSRLAVARPTPDLTLEIDVIDLHGNRTTVSSTPAFGYPAWSPDGTQIAFVLPDGGVAIVGVDGSQGTTRALPAIARSSTTLFWVLGQHP
jgi:WD40 repeat protein